MLYKEIWRAGVSGYDEKSEKFSLTDNIRLSKRSPKRASNISVGGAVSQFHTTGWAAVMVSAEAPSQSVSLALSGALAVAKG